MLHYLIFDYIPIANFNSFFMEFVKPYDEPIILQQIFKLHLGQTTEQEAMSTIKQLITHHATTDELYSFYYDGTNDLQLSQPGVIRQWFEHSLKETITCVRNVYWNTPLLSALHANIGIPFNVREIDRQFGYIVITLQGTKT